MLIAICYVPYYNGERERERFLLMIGERAEKGQGCNVTRQQHPKILSFEVVKASCGQRLTLHEIKVQKLILQVL
jgi:hypothetical protein